MICKVKQLEVGDTFIVHGHYWHITQIDDEPLGREIYLQDDFGQKRTKFYTREELATIEI